VACDIPQVRSTCKLISDKTHNTCRLSLTGHMMSFPTSLDQMFHRLYSNRYTAPGCSLKQSMTYMHHNEYTRKWSPTLHWYPASV